MAKWLDKYEQGGLVLKKKTKDNYGKKPNPNDVQASVGPNFVGLGYNTKGRNYSPAWGGQFQNGGNLSEKVLLHHPKQEEDDYTYALKKTVTPYKTNQQIKKNTKAPINPDDVDFLFNYRHTPHADPNEATATVVPYEGEKHWNIDRFITDSAFGSAYEHLKSDDDSIEAERRNVLADMFKYQMYQHPEQSRGKSFREAKRFVKNEIDPRVSGPYFQSYNRGQDVPPFANVSVTTYADTNPFYSAWRNMQEEETDANRDYRKNPWDESKIEKVATDYLKNTKKLSRKETKAQIEKWKTESKSMIQDYLNSKQTPQTGGGEPIQEMAMGGGIPGAVGFTYARVAGAAPANGKYAKKTKASAQNGEALPAPRYNAQGKRYLYDTDDPAFKDLVEGDITPASKSEFNPIRNTISDYVLSNTYLDRLKNFVPDPRFAKRVQLARAHQMLNTNIKSINEYVKPQNVVNDMPNVSRYDYTTNTVYFTPGEDSRATLAHEVAHSLLNSSTDEKNTNSALFLNPAERQAILGNLNVEGLNKLINSDPNLSWMAQDEHYNPGAKGEKIAANETYGDLLSLRLILNDNGVTKKFGDNLTPEMWEKALKNPKINKSPDIKRMRLKYKDKDLIEMNNKVAKNDVVIPNPNVEELIPIAQDGRRIDGLSRDVYDTYDPNRPDWKGGDPKSMKFRLEHNPYWKKLHEDAISMSQGDWINKHWVLASNFDGTYREKIKYVKEQYKASKDDVPYTDDELTKTKNELDAYNKWEQSKQQYLEGLAAQKAAEQKKIDEERTGKQKFIGDYSSKQKALKELENTFATKYGYIPGEQIGGDAHKMLVKKMIDEANQAIESGIGYNLFQDPKSEMTCINGVCTIAANAGVDFSQMANALGVVRDPEGRYIPQSNIGWAQNDAYKKAGFRKLAPGELPQEGDFAQYGDAGRLHHMELILGASPEGITTFNNYGQTLNPVPGSGREQRNFRKGSLNAEDFETTQYFRLDPKTEEAIVAKSPEYTKKAEAKKKLEASDEYKQYLEYQKFLEGNKGQFEEYQKALQQKQNGGEMSFYQQGLDFTPKTISKNGSVIKDDRGQWAHPGKITEIGSNNITMKGVDYPVLGISNTGDVKLMQPGENYKFKGEKVTEFPMMQKGGWLNKYANQSDATKNLGFEQAVKAQQDRYNRSINPANQPSVSQWNPKPGEVEAQNAREAERLRDYNSWDSKFSRNPHVIKGIKNLSDAGMFALDAMLLGEGTAALKGLAEPVIKSLAKKAANVATKAGTKALTKSEAKTIANNIKNAFYKEIGEPGSFNIYNKGSKNLQMFDAAGNEIATQKVLTPKEIKAHTKSLKNNWKTGATSDVPEGMSPYLNSEIDWGAWNSEIPKNHKLMKEYSAIEQQAKANGTWMKNADGTPFKGTPEQFVQIRSENFKKAFPEGADVTYRGDNEHYPELRPRGDKFFGQPIFTANEELAKYYTAKGNKAGFFSPNEATAFERLQTYLNENYPDLSIQEFMERYPNLARGAMATEQGGIHQLAIPRTKNVLELDAKGKMWSSLDNPEMNKKIMESGIEKSVYNKDTEPYLFTTDDIAQYIKQQDIDRALIRNVDDGSIGTVLIHNQKPGRFAKSLRGNSGMFDMNDPNIYKALIPAIGVGALGAAGATKQEKKNGGWLNKYK